MSALPIAGMRAADVYPDGRFPPTDYVAFDGEEIIGCVYRIMISAEKAAEGQGPIRAAAQQDSCGGS